MEGVPDDVLKSHQQRVMTQFQQAEAERQAATGNPPAGASASGQPAKKPKLENMSEMKKRLAEHRAKRAEGAAGGSSGDATPVGAGQNSPAPVTYVRPNIPSIQAPGEETDLLTKPLTGTTTACRRRTRATTPIPPTVRRRRRCPLPTNRKSRIPNLLPGQRPADSWRASVSTYRIFTSAIPRRTPSSRLRSHTTTIPSATTYPHRPQHPSTR
jgi:hypothetical protein